MFLAGMDLAFTTYEDGSSRLLKSADYIGLTNLVWSHPNERDKDLEETAENLKKAN